MKHPVISNIVKDIERKLGAKYNWPCASSLCLLQLTYIYICEKKNETFSNKRMKYFKVLSKIFTFAVDNKGWQYGIAFR